MNPALAECVLIRSNLAQLPACPSTGWVMARVTNSFTLRAVRQVLPKIARHWGGFSDKDVIALEKRPIKNGDQTIEFVVERKPTFVGVDPYLKLISRNTSNNVKRLGSKAGS
jgi:hypothetical protein